MFDTTGGRGCAQVLKGPLAAAPTLHGWTLHFIHQKASVSAAINLVAAAAGAGTLPTYKTVLPTPWLQARLLQMQVGTWEWSNVHEFLDLPEPVALAAAGQSTRRAPKKGAGRLAANKAAGTSEKKDATRVAAAKSAGEGGAAETKGAAGTAKKKGAKRVAATKAAGAAETKGAGRLVAAKSAQGARKRGTGHFTDIKSAEELSARLNIVSPQLQRQAWRVFVGIGKFEVNAQPYGDEAWLKAAARRRPMHSQRTEVSQARWEGRALGSHWYMDALPESESFEASMQAGNAMAESISKRVFIFYAEFKSHASFMDLMTECTRLAGPLAKKITSNGYQEQRFCKPHRYAVRQRAHAA